MGLVEKINDCRPNLNDLDISKIKFPKHLKKKIMQSTNLSIDSLFLPSVRGLLGEYFVSDWIKKVEGFDKFYKENDLTSDSHIFKDSSCNGINIYCRAGDGHLGEIDSLVSIDEKDYLVEVKTCKAEMITPFILNKLDSNLSLFSKALGHNLSYLLFLSKQICDVNSLQEDLTCCELVDLGFSKGDILNFSLDVTDNLKNNKYYK
jgi:hypothetical protein